MEGGRYIQYSTPQQSKEKMCKQRGYHRVHTEWQWPHSGVYSIMMEKSGQPGEGGGCTHTPFHYILYTITYKVVVYAAAERTVTLPLFLLYSYTGMYSVGDTVYCTFFYVRPVLK